MRKIISEKDAVDMNIHEIREVKEECEKSIEQLLQAFESKTGCNVYSLVMNRIDVTSFTKFTKHGEFRYEVILDVRIL